MTAPEPIAPGVYDGLKEEAYHADPALSASGARLLLPPSCPAHYRWQRDHGEPPKRTFDFGSAAHAKVLGVGAEIVVVQKTLKDGAKVDADDYKTKSAGEHRDAIRAEGKVPLLRDELERVDAMADSLRSHPFAGALFDPDRGGRPEVSLFWHDSRHGVDRRARLDWLPNLTGDGRLILADLKTTASAERSAFSKSVGNFGYAVQAVFYTDAVRAHDLAEDVAFVFVAIEKDPPHIVQVYELDGDWLRIGRTDTDRACSVFADCTATGQWPTYSNDVELLSPPVWLARQYEDVIA